MSGDDLDPHELGNCCCCEKGAADGVVVRTVVMLDKKCPTPGKGWGCFVCDLPKDGAIYVACDACADSGAKPKLACRGWPGKDGRIPIEELEGAHDHDLAKHEEAPLFASAAASARFDNSEFTQPLAVGEVRTCRVCGCTDDSACLDTASDEPCYWVEPDLCSACVDPQIFGPDGTQVSVHDAVEMMIRNSAGLEDLDDGPRILGPDGRPFYSD
jgi:hypothetical protein